jgi:hypothetical protein
VPFVWLTGRLRKDLRSPAAVVGRALIAQMMFHWCSRESAIASAVALALLAIAAITPLTPSSGWGAEWAVIAASSLVLGYVIYLGSKLPQLVHWLLVFARLRLAPRQFARALVVHLVARALQELDGTVRERVEQSSWLSRRSYDLLAGLIGGDRDATAYALAREIEPDLWSYAVRAAALGVVPWLIILTSFRVAVTYGQLLDRSTHLGFFEALAYPIAAAIDLVFHTELRAVLRAP